MAEQARGEAFSGNGYGTRRRMLYENARDQIERSIQSGFYGEALALCESILGDMARHRVLPFASDLHFPRRGLTRAMGSRFAPGAF